MFFFYSAMTLHLPHSFPTRRSSDLVLTERFVLPSGSKLTGISVNNSGEILLDGNAHIYPTQPAVEFDSISEFVPIDSSIYNSNHPFPTETSILKNDAYTMGYHVITVEICPFQ